MNPTQPQTFAQHTPHTQRRILLMCAGFFLSIMLAASVGEQYGRLIGGLAGTASFLVVSLLLTAPQPALFFNNIGGLNNTTLFHDAFTEFWQILLPVTRLCINVANDVTLDNGDTVLVRTAKPGDTVTIKNWMQTFNVYTVGAGGYNSPTDLAPTDKSFTLPNTAKACSIQLTAPEFRVISGGATGGADYDAFKKKIVNGMLFSVGAAVVTDLLALFTSTNYPTKTVIPAGTMGRAAELKVEKAFFDRKVPLENAQMILSSAAFTDWVSDHTPIQTNTGINVQRPMLFMGERQSLTTPFTMQRTNLTLPAGTNGADTGIALQRSAVVGAFRIPEEPTWEGDPVSLARVIDPHTGVGCLVRIWKVGGGSTGAMQLDIAAIWKLEVGQPECAERLTLT